MPDARVKLLIVDDDVPSRKHLAVLFSELGYCVRSVRDGASALSEIRHEFPDMLLSELNMIGMSGVEFLLAVRRLFPSIRVVVMSGASSGTCVPPGIAADAFLEKGPGLTLLIKTLDAMIQPGRAPSRQRSVECSTWISSARAVPASPVATVSDKGLIACQ